MSKNSMNPAAAVIGAALVGSLSAANLAQAAENPFGAEQLESGYLMLATGEGSCGEGKCGAKDGGEGKCGEGKCGNKDEGEGKCGEGKCGGAS